MMSFKVSLASLIGFLLVFSIDEIHALDNGLALTPPMGWLAWERFTCEIDCVVNPDNCISDKLFMSMAEKLVDDGYRNVGYEYVNIDDCWSTKEREPRNDRLIPDPVRFPGGIGTIADFMHSKGLKLGIYGDCGTSTCAGYPAQLKSNASLADNYFDTDAKTLRDWHIDSFKFDGCFIDPFRAESICPEMSKQLLLNQRENEPILLSCEWPFYMLRQNRSSKPDFNLAAKSCNLWRYYEDIEDSWQNVLNVIDFTVAMQDTIIEYHGPGHWFDPDQLVIGNFGLSLDEARAQMAIWSVWSAPLYMSNDLRDIDPAMARILKNKNLIEVDQDRLGVFGLRVEELKGTEIYVKPVEPINNGCPSIVIAYLNRNTLGNRQKVSMNILDLLRKSRRAIELAIERAVRLSRIRSSGKASLCLSRLEQKSNMRKSVIYQVKDLFEDKLLPPVSLNSTLDLWVNPSGVRIVKLIEL